MRENIIVLKHFKMCLELILNNPDMMIVIDNKKYIRVKDLKGELSQINQLINKEVKNEQ